MQLNGRGLVFDTTGNDEVSYQIAEGYKAFRLKSTQRDDDNTLSLTLKNLVGDIIQEQSFEIRTIDEIRLKITALSGTPKVGNLEYKYALEFQDEDGVMLQNLNSRVYLTIGKLFGTVKNTYVEVKQ